jgi:hypothetical protein
VKNPNLSQLIFLLNNDKNAYLAKYVSKEDFLFVFIEHLIEFFKKNKSEFNILEPLLDPILEKEQQTILSVDGIEVGELHLLFNSFFDESSLVYYSPSGLLELNLFEFEDYIEFEISDYILLINEFAALLMGEKNLYQKMTDSLQ